MSYGLFSQPHFLVSALLLGAVLFAWLIYREVQKDRQLSARLEQEQQERDKARCVDIEEGLREWLRTLGLPQLEEETRLRETAHLLRIVLVEQLMNGPRVR